MTVTDRPAASAATTSTTAHAPAPQWRWLRDSRPPASCWTPPALTNPAQPSLLSMLERPEPPGVVVRGDRSRRGTPAPGPPDPGEWGGRLTYAVLQVLAGRRPAQQLDRWMSEEVLAQIAMAAALARRQRRTERPGTDRTEAGPAYGIVSVRAQRPQPAYAEVAVHIREGRRGRAVAVRLDAIGDRWLCTAFDRGPDRLSC